MHRASSAVGASFLCPVRAMNARITIGVAEGGSVAFSIDMLDKLGRHEGKALLFGAESFSGHKAS